MVVTNAQASGESSASVVPAADEDPGLFGMTGRRIGAVLVGLATLIGTGAALWPLLK